jgi:DNA-binding transcriptional MerR regulator
MLTVSELAKRCGLSRTAILYYESIGLLSPPHRTASNYRSYAGPDLDRLQQICAYRNAGLELDDIKALLDQPRTESATILKRRLRELDAEIETRRHHQKAILLLLQNKNTLRRTKMMTKDKWTGIMRAAGFTDDDMRRWHIEFERAAPDDHQQFLESLHIPAPEIVHIRKWSRNPELTRP